MYDPGRESKVFQLRWLWKNMKGSRAAYIAALFLSIACNAMYITSPYFQSKIIDTFISNDNALENLKNEKSLLWWLLVGMVTPLGL